MLKLGIALSLLATPAAATVYTVTVNGFVAEGVYSQRYYSDVDLKNRPFEAVFQVDTDLYASGDYFHAVTSSITLGSLSYKSDDAGNAPYFTETGNFTGGLSEYYQDDGYHYELYTDKNTRANDDPDIGSSYYLAYSLGFHLHSTIDNIVDGDLNTPVSIGEITSMLYDPTYGWYDNGWLSIDRRVCPDDLCDQMGSHDVVWASLRGMQYSVGQPVTLSSFGIGIPEPSSWALMILGFASVGTMLRRKVRMSLDNQALA